jgi:putative DNA primase/helicase
MTHQAREPYGAPFYFKNIAKIIATCNRLPENYDSSHGLFRRLLIVPFNAKFSRGDEGFDPFLEKKIIASELPGVFNRCLAGYKRLVRQGDFTHSDASRETSASYMELAKNSTITWAEENLEFDAKRFANGDGEKVMEMYELYKQDAEARGEQIHSFKKFSLQIRELFRHANVYLRRIHTGETTMSNVLVGIRKITGDSKPV